MIFQTQRKPEKGYAVIIILHTHETYVYTYIHMYKGYGVSTLKENILSMITFALYMLV